MRPAEIQNYRSHIEAALQYSGGTHTFEDIVEGVERGELQFWPGPDSVIVTEIAQYPRRKALHFFLAGGHLPELEAMTPEILAWGREQGCNQATLCGRRGWDRTFLTRTGWAVTQELVVLEKSLNE